MGIEPVIYESFETAYAYCNQEETDEKFYDCGVDYNDLESSLRWMSDDVVTKVTPDLIGKRYTYVTNTQHVSTIRQRD